MTWEKTLPLTGTDPDPAEITQMWAAAETRGAHNLFADPQQLIWPAGDGPAAAAVPAHFFFTGSGAKTCERQGFGLSDPTYYLKRGWTSKLIAGSDTAKYGQTIIPSALFDDYYVARYASFGWPVKCASVNAARIVIDDGNKQTASAWCGTAGWNWLTVSHQIDAAASKLVAQLEVAAGVTAYSGAGMTGIWGEVPPAYFMPPPVVYGTLFFPVVGSLTVGDGKSYFFPARPLLVKDVQLVCLTAPATQAIIVDVDTWDGSAWGAAFSTRPQIAAGAFRGAAQPDGAYARRCLNGLWGTTLNAGGGLRVNIDQVGVGTPGSDLFIHVRALQYARFLEPGLGHADIN